MAESSTSKKLPLQDFINTVSISERDKWVLNKIYAKDKETRTATAWTKAIKEQGIAITTPSK